MSRAQGDAYRTHTDHELNAYKAKLDAKLRKLIDHKEKWYRAGAGWILCQERNRMTNPNGWMRMRMMMRSCLLCRGWLLFLRFPMFSRRR